MVPTLPEFACIIKKDAVLTLPRLGSTVRIRSPAPIIEINQLLKWVQAVTGRDGGAFFCRFSAFGFFYLAVGAQLAAC